MNTELHPGTAVDTRRSSLSRSAQGAQGADPADVSTSSTSGGRARVLRFAGGLVVLGFLLSLVFAKILAKVVVLVVVVGLGFLVWQQRTSVENKIKDNACGGYTFFGVHLDPPDDIQKECK